MRAPQCALRCGERDAYVCGMSIPQAVDPPNKLILAILLGVTGLSGCAAAITAGSSKAQQPTGEVAVTISPTSIALKSSQQQSCSAKVQNDPQSKGVTWTVT